MKKKFVIPAVLLSAVAAGGLLYFTHTYPMEKVAAAIAPAPPPAVPIVAGGALRPTIAKTIIVAAPSGSRPFS